jgi:hypothetical protein
LARVGTRSNRRPPTADRRLLSALEAGAGSFEGAADRLDGHLQHVGYLAGVESEDVAQDEDGDLARASIR